jgi:Flp pilus assembly protein TadG
LVELAVTLPLLLILAFGAAQFVRLAIARAGLDAATAAAVAAAARAPNAKIAVTAGSAAFKGVAAGYRLDPSTAVTIVPGTFERGGKVTAQGTSAFDLGFSGVPALGVRWRLVSAAAARIEDWRSRATQP